MNITSEQEPFSVRASRMVGNLRNVYGSEFCDRHSNEIADIIFHAITNFVHPTTSCGKDHNQLAWDYIILHVKELDR